MAHASESLHGDGLALEVSAAGGLEHRRADSQEAAEGRRGARISAAAFLDAQAGDVRGRPQNGAEIGNADVHVLGRDVRAAEVLDEAPHGLEELLGLVARVGDDDGLAAAEAGAGDRRLVGHRP